MYQFRSIWVRAGAKLRFKQPTQIVVTLGMFSDLSSYIGPQNGTSISASDIVFYVGGADGQCSFPSAAVFGPAALSYANYSVPNGTVWLIDQTQATGAFIARDIVVGSSVQLTLAPAFTRLLKTDSPGWTLEPENDAATAAVPVAFSLQQNYPNPFNPSTVIQYELPDASPVRIVVYDLLGREVSTLVNEVQPAGEHTVQFNATRLASGMYLYRMTAGTFVETRRMLVLK